MLSSKGSTVQIDFNPRPPRGGRPWMAWSSPPGSGISIHAPREGGDPGILIHPILYPAFQSTPPARGATIGVWSKSMLPSWISIHAPREGGDVTTILNSGIPVDFNPRPPRGGRPPEVAIPTSGCTFQSTPPARGATAEGFTSATTAHHISIHAPREGGDCNAMLHRAIMSDFNPRPPRGGRLRFAVPSFYRKDFNPRPPRGGRLLTGVFALWLLRFQSTPPARGATRGWFCESF